MDNEVTFESLFMDFSYDKDIVKLYENLRKYFPCPDTPFRKATWSIPETVLIFHNIDPYFFNNIEFDHQRNNLVTAIKLFDSPYGLYECLESHYGVCSVHYTYNHILVSKLPDFLKSKGLEVPAHFPEFIFKNGKASSGNEIDNPKQFVKKYDFSSFSSDEQGIIIARVLASRMWTRDKKLSQTDIVNDSRFESIMREFYELAGAQKPSERELKTEWISDLDPRPSKPGRQKKNK